MAALTLVFNVGNKAYQNDLLYPETLEQGLNIAAVANTIIEFSDKILHGRMYGSINDINGNYVGSWTLL